MKRKKLTKVVFVFLCVCYSLRAAANASDRDKAFDILDAWTCVRWGEDNIAWVVHYPEELVDPWVRSEAEKQKMRPEQAEELRKSFSDELRMGSATAVLLSVYGYGASPINLSPAGKNIVLIDSSGKRASPIAFEKKLDNPISGLVQGFIFFPLQSDKNFRIVVQGLTPNRETNFAFSGTGQPVNAIATAPDNAEIPLPQRNAGEKEVVVKIPTKPKPTAEKPKTPKPPEPIVEEEPISPDTGEVFAPTQPVVPEPEPTPPAVTEAPKPQAPILAPKQVLDIFIKAWIGGDTDRMYSLLSAESQSGISKEKFAAETASGGFRNALRSGYKVTWTEEGDTAKVTAARKVLFVRTLESKQIKFVTEDGSARVSW
jgi:hypothetical protein